MGVAVDERPRSVLVQNCDFRLQAVTPVNEEVPVGSAETIGVGQPSPRVANRIPSGQRKRGHAEGMKFAEHRAEIIDRRSRWMRRDVPPHRSVQAFEVDWLLDLSHQADRRSVDLGEPTPKLNDLRHPVKELMSARDPDDDSMAR
ncbi:hypothetical protein F4558_004301 [Micromonospora profundi]|nr:hypothetical protein [Micromonospora profundi]